MSTSQTASIYIKNKSDLDANISLYHVNATNKPDSAGFFAKAGETVGPMTVHFKTGVSVAFDGDLWAVRFTTISGDSHKVYANKGGSKLTIWKECQLQSKDANQSMTFTVDEDSFDIKLKSGGTSTGMQALFDYHKVPHVFVLMLENHSFDNIFAMSGIPGISAATRNDYNSYKGINYYVDNQAPVSMPTDPGHEFLDVVEQLAGMGASYPSGGPYPTINNSGFVANYATSDSESSGLPSQSEYVDIMRCFDTPNDLPVIYTLATEFAICDHWFSAMPGPTWPNRFFVHGASSSGLDDSPTTYQISEWESVDGFSYAHGSIYDYLKKNNINYALYNDDNNSFTDEPGEGSVFGAVAQVSSLKGITISDVKSINDLPDRLRTQPYDIAYTFIEPNYGNVFNDTYAGGSSQHPEDDMSGGENLIKFVYETLRNSPIWNNCMLIITYDEHGGFYDHKPPPSVSPPNDGSEDSSLNTHGFPFNLLGPRVPGVVISPWLEKGTLLQHKCDHSSVLRTVEHACRMNALTDRDESAYDLTSLLTCKKPRTDCPSSLPAPVKLSSQAYIAPSAEEMEAIRQKPLPESGNMIGTLGILLKEEVALLATDDESKQSIIESFKCIKTYGQAQDYARRIMAMVEERKAERKAKEQDELFKQ